jgi:hypothetical protein
MKYLPPFKIRFSQGQDGPCHELVSGKHFHFGLSAVGSRFWANPPPRLLDLLRVATSIYVRERPHKQCGVCPSCIVRRQAMAVAGIEEPGVYKYDLFGSAEAADAVPEDGLMYLKAILLQVANLGPLDPDSRVPDRVRRHLLATSVVSREECMAPFLRLLSRYRHEWLDIAAQGMEPGWAWTNLLAPVGAALVGEENHASA